MRVKLASEFAQKLESRGLWAKLELPLSFVLNPRITMFFIHVPKTGGRYVKAAFSKAQETAFPYAEPDYPGHKTYREYCSLFQRKGLDLSDFLTFSCVRNPWDWHLSWYHYIREDEGGRDSGHQYEHHLFNNISFSDYIVWLDSDDPNRSPQDFMRRSQIEWLINDQGNLAVDFVFKAENLVDQLTSFRKKLYLAIEIPPEKVGNSKHKGRVHYYNHTTIDIVARRHAEEIRRFGYRFDE